MSKKLTYTLFALFILLAGASWVRTQGNAQPSLDDQIRSAEEKVEKLKRLKALKEEARRIEQELNISKTDEVVHVESVKEPAVNEKGDRGAQPTTAVVIPSPPPVVVPPQPAPAVPQITLSQVDAKKNLFADAPAVLKDDAQLFAKGILFDMTQPDFDPADRVDDRYPRLFFLTVSSKTASGQGVNSLSNLEPIRFLLETARTDKQIGASSSSSASTSAIDKPGFANLLGFAIENGVIEKNINDTVLTLSTSPSALFTMTEKDATKAYRNAGLFNKIGVSASFNISNQNSLLANVSRSQLRDYSIRYRFYGDRSSRSPELEKIWERDIVPMVQSFLIPLNKANVLLDQSQLRVLRTGSAANLTEVIRVRVGSAEFKALKEEEKITDLTNITLNFVKLAVADGVTDDPAGTANGSKILVDAATRTKIKDEITVALLSAQQQQKATSKLIAKRLDDFFKGPIGTVAYTNYRDPLGNYSEFKFLYEQNDTFLKPLKLVANGGFTFYHKPNPLLNQEKVRDLSIAVSLEGKFTSPFNEVEDLSQITYSFTGRYQRFVENQNMANRKADLAKFQFLLNMPLFKGLILPFSVTYSNATELERKSGVRVNFGLKFDADKLFELVRFNRTVL